MAAVWLVGSTPANAAAGATPAATSAPVSGASAVEARTTTLEAGYPNLLGLGLVLQRPTARLTDAETGQPLAGMRVYFGLADCCVPYACSGITDANGVARCGGLRQWWDFLLLGGYVADFPGATVGDVHYGGSRGTVRLLGP